MLGQLKVLRSGRHPKTFLPIPRPISLKQWELNKLNPPTPRPASPSRPRLPPDIANDASDLILAFLSRGKREPDPNDHMPPWLGFGPSKRRERLRPAE